MELSSLEQSLGYAFRNQALLLRALTHPSLGAHESNQRLEFLGDAVLEMCVSDRLYRDMPRAPEGDLTRQRMLRVCESALLSAATHLKLGDFLLIERGAARMGVRQLDGARADAMEAVLAAVYLDGGMDEAAKLVDRLWAHLAPEQIPDSKSLLQEFTQQDGGDAPVYETICEEGPPHQRRFKVGVLLSGKRIATGEGTSKKRAEQQAARQALDLLAPPSK